MLIRKRICAVWFITGASRGFGRIWAEAALKRRDRRGEDGSWTPAFSPAELTAAIHGNLRNLELDVLDVVNQRSRFTIHEPAEGSIEAPLTVLAELQQNVDPTHSSQRAKISLHLRRHSCPQQPALIRFHSLPTN